MRRIFNLLPFFLFLLPAAAPGAEGNLNQVVNALEAPFKADAARQAILDMQADFSQVSRLTSLDRQQHGGGKVAIQFSAAVNAQAPLTRFRWDYDRPTEQAIVSDGRTMWVYLPENRQVIESEIDSAGQNRTDDPMTFLTGLGNLSRDFQITWASPHQDAEGNYALELRPRRPSPLIDRMLVVVDRQAVHAKGQKAVFPIVSTSVFDPGGNSTWIEFGNTRVNRGIAADRFRFVPPAGVEVLHPSEGGMGF